MYIYLTHIYATGVRRQASDDRRTCIVQQTSMHHATRNAHNAIGGYGVLRKATKLWRFYCRCNSECHGAPAELALYRSDRSASLRRVACLFVCVLRRTFGCDELALAASEAFTTSYSQKRVPTDIACIALVRLAMQCAAKQSTAAEGTHPCTSVLDGHGWRYCRTPTAVCRRYSPPQRLS